MARFALQLAFFIAGLNFVAPKLGESLGVHVSHNHAALLFLLVALLGCGSFRSVGGFARAWPVLACVLIAWLGLCYGTGRTNNRGVLNVVFVTLALPVAALIVEHRCWWLCTKMFVLGNAAAMTATIWFEYLTHRLGILQTFFRFGNLQDATGTMRLANPNQVGVQLAVAAVLALILHLQSTLPQGSSCDSAAGKRFSLGWFALLSIGCILTGSRGAFVAWLGGVSVLVFLGTKSLMSRRLKDLLAISSILVLLTLLMVTATGYRPWQTLQARLEDPVGLLTGSARMTIWKAALQVWISDPRIFLVGTGTGLVPLTLGRQLGFFFPDGITVCTIDSHNAFVEWGLSFGLVGIVAGGCLLIGMWRRARQLDRRDGIVCRQALLLCFCLMSMSCVTIFEIYFIALGGLMLAMLSAPARTEALRHRTLGGPHASGTLASLASPRPA